ncbi:MAG: hypothetical protein ACI97A_002079 [Planctomycetota bacterium]|jgi:hypothetical protein
MKIRFSILIIVVSVSAVALLQGQESKKKDDGPSDGPYIFHNADGSRTARWLDDGTPKEKKFAKGEKVTLPEFAALIGASLECAPHNVDASIWSMPEKLMVISDVEGQHKRLKKFLIANKVTDKDGKWAFGKGHLVCVGDFVDRGKKVTEVLWTIYRLEKEALAAGGRVHMVLGNHEVMLLTGDERYLAKKYLNVSKAMGMKIHQLLGANTELGRWLRTRNSLIRIGEYVFVHGGVSPWLAHRKVDYDGVNKMIRAVLTKDRRVRDSAQATALFWGRQGPLWYRGYFKKHEAGFGPYVTASQMDKILKSLGGKTIIIGHTKVKKVLEVYPKKRVIDIDTTWVKNKKVHGLRIVKDQIRIVDIDGESSLLESDKDQKEN